MRSGNFSQILTGHNLGTDTQGNAIMENTIYDPATEQTVNSAVVRSSLPRQHHSGEQVRPSRGGDPVVHPASPPIPA